MSPELDKQLVEKYPKIFANRHASPETRAMCWGFECGDGWFNILDKMCRNIQWHIDHSRKDRARALRFNRALRKALKGNIEPLIKNHTYGDSPNSRQWAEDTVKKLMSNNPQFRPVPEACTQVVASQVKEKFGMLTIYHRGGNSYTDGVLRVAEEMSRHVCEECGKPGYSTATGWIRTLCDEHHAKI